VVAVAWLVAHASPQTSGQRASLRSAAADSFTSTTSTVPTATDASGAATPSSAAATNVCQTRLAQYAGRDNPMHVSLIAAYDTSPGDLAAEDERRHGAAFRSPWRDRAAGEFEALCFFDADGFGVVASHRPPDPAKPRPYDRIVEVVRPDGVPVVFQAGQKEGINPAPMPSADGMP
jgi:hypothetical protein